MRQRSNLIIILGIAFFVIGGVIVFLVLNDDDSGSSGSSGNVQPVEVTVFVANADIATNTIGEDVIADGLLAAKQVVAGTQPVGAITNASDLNNKIFAIGVSEGDVITNAQLSVRSLANIEVPEGFDGVAVTLPFTAGGAGYIAPGDTINIFGIFGEASIVDGGVLLSDLAALGGAEIRVPRTELLLTNILVLDVDVQATTAAAAQAQAQGGAPVAGRPSTSSEVTFLLAMKPSDIERLVHLTQFAEMYVSLQAEDAGPAGDEQGADGGNIVDPVSATSAAPEDSTPAPQPEPEG